MNAAEIERQLVTCFDGTEWNLSLWFPRVTREVVRFPAGISDAEIQQCLLGLIHSGTLETGTVEGSEFAPAPFDPAGTNARCPDLYVRAVALPATR